MVQLDRDAIETKYFPKISHLWLTSKNDFPDFLSEYSNDQKQDHENYLDECMHVLQRHRKSFFKSQTKQWLEQTNKKIVKMISNQSIIPSASSLSDQFIASLQSELLLFLKSARQSAPELSIQDLGQAIRNYMVFAMFKKIHEITDGFSAAAFGYSMLYPFTDNFIDDPCHSSAQKNEYNEMIHKKITGSFVCPSTNHQKKTCDFLSAIESDFPRHEDSTIYVLLQMMLEAQIDSLRQQKKFLLNEQERLEISIAKGGLSVFIDRYLVKKELTEKDILFYFGFGLFLQLADDLQDIEEDSTKGSQTIFTVDTSASILEEKVNRLLHFTHNIITNYEMADQSFKEFVSYCSYQLILTSIMKSKKYFSKDYLNNINRYLPVSMKYIETKMLLNQPVSTKNEERVFEFLDDILEEWEE